MSHRVTAFLSQPTVDTPVHFLLVFQDEHTSHGTPKAAMLYLSPKELRKRIQDAAVDEGRTRSLNDAIDRLPDPHTSLPVVGIDLSDEQLEILGVQL
jgi:hypothetical protein